jgi:hypothetical protein
MSLISVNKDIDPYTFFPSMTLEMIVCDICYLDKDTRSFWVCDTCRNSHCLDCFQQISQRPNPRCPFCRAPTTTESTSSDHLSWENAWIVYDLLDLIWMTEWDPNEETQTLVPDLPVEMEMDESKEESYESTDASVVHSDPLYYQPISSDDPSDFVQREIQPPLPARLLAQISIPRDINWITRVRATLHTWLDCLYVFPIHSESYQSQRTYVGDYMYHLIQALEE